MGGRVWLGHNELRTHLGCKTTCFCNRRKAACNVSRWYYLSRSIGELGFVFYMLICLLLLWTAKDSYIGARATCFHRGEPPCLSLGGLCTAYDTSYRSTTPFSIIWRWLDHFCTTQRHIKRNGGSTYFVVLHFIIKGPVWAVGIFHGLLLC